MRENNKYFVVNIRWYFNKSFVERGEKHLENSVENMEMVGYFTLALKPLSVKGRNLSKTTKRKLQRISEIFKK